MEFLVIVGAPVVLFLLWRGQGKLTRRITALEADLAALRLSQGLPAAVPPLAEAPPAPDAAPVPAAPLAAATAQPTPGPWSGPASSAPPLAATNPDEAPNQNQPLVIRADRLAALTAWLRDNWVYAVSALSLALAGVFFVQYGVENGLLPPVARVTLAILFGAALIVAGEWIRRRHGDGTDHATAYLPSVFSGAGLVAMFAGVLAARQLYDLIGPETAFAGLLFTAALAVALGWFYGPLLAAIGLLGAAAAPFVVGGNSDAPVWLYAYFALVGAVGLAVDAVRRWAWVSVLALVLAYACGGLLLLSGAGQGGWAALLVALPLLSVAVPVLRLVPDHGGLTITESLLRIKAGVWPAFPTRLAGGAVLVSSLALCLTDTTSIAESWLAFGGLAVLVLALLIWAERAPALADLAALPVLAFLVRLVGEPVNWWPLAADLVSRTIADRPPETAAPWTQTGLLALATLMTLAFAWRGFRNPAYRVLWGLGVALTAPVAVLLLELFWFPSLTLGTYPWALHVMALAALMVALTLAFARADGEDRRRAAYGTLAALSLIALALFLVTTKAALTLALAALIVIAAALDRRFRLPEMALFIQAGVLVLGYRLVLDPGLDWALEADLLPVIASFAGAVAAALAALKLLQGLPRPSARVTLESAAAGTSALLANVLISRWLTAPQTDYYAEWEWSYWGLTLNALPWIVLMLVQLYRMQLGGVMFYVRAGIALVAGLMGFGGLILAAGPANPMWGFNSALESAVYGPLVFNTLALAYALPGLILLLAVPRLPHLRRWLRYGLLAIGTALLALYSVLEIRHFWRGPDLWVPGVTQPELYSYTLALMLLGAVLLYQAIARRSGTLRRVAMAVIALTVAKVFLLDASGLTGLTRVVSFLGLGLSLAGLAWLNRWAMTRQGETPPPSPTP